jgi:GTP-binding protein HflX
LSNNGGKAEKFTGRTLVVSPFSPDGGAARSPEMCLEEASGLASAIDLEIAHREVVRVAKRRPATLLGKGAVERFAGLVEAEDIDIVIVDSALTPIQQRNLERAWKTKVIDRTGLILEIFGARARTHEGRLQVELASLSYQRTRLVRSWTHLERQRGGFGFLGGPGESQLEIDRRLIDQRIIRLKKDLATVRRTRALHRKARKRVPFPVVALVGYTNAGKSTLFNRLTRSKVVARDTLFATLDPTMRSVGMPSGRKFILSDTVGFISELPTQLVAAFHATLEEVAEADLVVHVRDISHPDSEAQRQDVEAVLAELGLAGITPLEVLNKIDLLDARARTVIFNRAERNTEVVAVSALDGTGCDALLAALDRRLSEGRRIVVLQVDLSDGAALAWLYKHGEVVERRDEGLAAHLSVALDDSDEARFRRRFQDDRP